MYRNRSQSQNLTASLVVVARVAEGVGVFVVLALKRKREGEGVACLGVVTVGRVEAVEASVTAADIGAVDACLLAAIAAIITYARGRIMQTSNASGILSI